MTTSRLARIDKQLAEEIESIRLNMKEKTGADISFTQASKLFYFKNKNRKFEL